MEGTNLLGKSHKKYVQEQIKIRQEKLGKFNKDSTDISWMNGKTSWVRLASSVNVENSTIRVPLSSEEIYKDANYKAGGDTTSSQNVSPNLNKIIEINLNSLNEAGEIGTDIEVPTGEQRLKLLGLSNEWMGNALAKNIVLIGGVESHKTITETEDGFTANKIIRKGVTPTSFPVYEGKDFGLVAMPGIQSVDVKSKSMGSLREANISLRVNDALQLELIETIYLRLGYSMFLEWGNSSYFNNGGEYIKGATVEPGLIYDFLSQESPTQQDIDRILTTRMFDLDGDGVEDPLTEEQIEYFKSQLDSVQILSQKIEEERKRSCGNYDALFGKVTNFSWEFDPAGFYNVSLTLISWGDIIESLSINSFFPDIDLVIDSEGNVKKEEVDKKNSSALEAFVYESTLPGGDSWESEGKILNATLEPTKNTLLSNNTTKTGTFNLFNTSTWSPKVETQTASDYSDVLNYDRSQTNSNKKIISCNAVFGNNRVYKYVRFGDLLDFIKHKLLIYNNIAPIVDIDTTPGRNFCYNPKINVSADPSKVMIRRDLPPITKKDLTPQELSEVGAYLTAGEYQITEGVFNSKLPYDSKDVETSIESFDAKVPGVDVEGGDIMNIYFEKDYLYTEIDNLMDSRTGKISLYRFVKKLLDTANSCLGGVNQLDLRIKDDRILEIYDQVPLYGVKKEEPIQQFNIYGVQENRGSFVTNFGLKTELTNAFATTVAIGAQAQGDVVGEDATMLSRWNFGLVDRFIPKKIDSITRDLKEKDKEFKEFTALTEKIKSLWRAYQIQVYGDIRKTKGDIKALNFPLMFKQETFASYVTLQKNFFKSFIKLETNTHSSNPYRMSNQIGMLPINLNLEMDGLSGIRIYDQINVDTRFLPSYYPNYLIFIVKGVSHTFVGNRWVTKIDTIAQPKVQFQEDLGLQKKFSYKPVELPVEPTGTEEFTDDDLDDPAVFWNGDQKVGKNGTLPPTVRAFKAAGIVNGEVPASIKRDLTNKIPLRGASQPYLFIDAYNSLIELHKAAVAAKLPFTVTGADRDYALQEQLYAQYGPGAAADPGTSNHGWAIAIDIGDLYQEVKGSSAVESNLEARKRSELYDFLAQHGPFYGWYNPWVMTDRVGTEELWHWEWWGTPSTPIPGLDYNNLPDGLDLSDPLQQWGLNYAQQQLNLANQ